MGKKVFVSYKYSDSAVCPLRGSIQEAIDPTTVRHYVDELQGLLEADDHINKGENDDESLEGFKDSTIASKLRDKIFDSSITIVMISPNMKDNWKSESDQWIPWEISYSLSEHSRSGITSRSNAVLAVVLPDINNSYHYFIEEYNCCTAGCRIFQTDKTFRILKENLFNSEDRTPVNCGQGKTIYRGDEPSYITIAKWSDFINDINSHLENSTQIKDNIDNYTITKQVA